MLRSLSGRSSTLVSIRPPRYDLAMSKQLTPRQRLKALFPVPALPPDRGRIVAISEERKTGTSDRTRIEAPITKSFQKGKAQPRRPERPRPATRVARVGGVRGKERRRAEETDVEEASTVFCRRSGSSSQKSRHERYCLRRLLSKGKEAEGRYKDRNVDTLRRVLYEAKRLAQTAEVMATPLKEVIACRRLRHRQARRRGVKGNTNKEITVCLSIVLRLA